MAFLELSYSLLARTEKVRSLKVKKERGEGVTANFSRAWLRMKLLAAFALI